jgi:hypothetical protein
VRLEDRRMPLLTAAIATGRSWPSIGNQPDSATTRMKK